MGGRGCAGQRGIKNIYAPYPDGVTNLVIVWHCIGNLVLHGREQRGSKFFHNSYKALIPFIGTSFLGPHLT